MMKENVPDDQTLLTRFVAHSLKNSLAEISAEAHSLSGNRALLRAVQGLSRIVSDTLYFQQLQAGEPGVSGLKAPPGENILAEEFFELLQLRLQPEVEALQVSLSFSFEPEAWLFTNLDLSLDALERLVLVAMNGISPGGVLPVSAVSTPPAVTIGAPGKAFWPDLDSPRDFPEKERLSFLVARRLLEFLGCRLVVEGADHQAQGLCRICFPVSAGSGAPL
ncbi:hypothetical protein SAMN05920897_103163 [Alkalispirochaeta americana]|uniref:Uncharacterized protein n=1 Tax=Alkalispirochaeta americana TaxID=159291 RepID=A0A1N6PW79_9SPIO|nr:hypothetical protein [Alkalispirochaeta americana]SIQ08638.1 hypothetical protein SAMN05920897_103163 [Alkalispirochaeta americana]